ncbi:MAG: carbon-nitrogen hydrolase family protein [Gemmatimonadaceae bacterium]
MKAFRIALANVRPGKTRDESVAIATDAIGRAAAAGASIVCFPECYVPGYRYSEEPGLPIDEKFLEHAWRRIADAARESNIAVILGTERIVDGDARLTAMVVDRDGSILGFQDKVQLDPTEENDYQPGAGRELFVVDDVPFGVVICHEGFRYPETTRAAVRLGAKVVFHPHFSWPEGGFRPSQFADPRNTFHEKAVLCRAAENTCYFATVNGAVDGSPTTSAVVNPDGTLLAWQPYGTDGLLVTDLDLYTATGLLASRCRT